MSPMERLRKSLQFLVDEAYDTWGGVGVELRDGVEAFNERFPELAVVIPKDAR